MSVILTVSQINKYIASKIRGDMKLKSIAVKGEISNLNMNYSSGRYYFTLKDENSSLKAIMFSNSARNLRIDLKNGLSVMVLGNIDCYERDGIYQIVVTDIQPIGVGTVKESLDNLKSRLNEKGYFKSELKKKIPDKPKAIGVVTSSSGAALQDILNILERRYPICKVYVFPTLVQGSDAKDSITDALMQADAMNLDTIILARGGGSAEDLSVFNEEKVADAIFNVKTPIISAVGHETDFTIADLVADLRAATPSEAAERASDDISTYYSHINNINQRIKKALLNRISDSHMLLKYASDRILSSSPKKRLEIGDVKLRNTEQRLKICIDNIVSKYENRLNSSALLLDSYSPLKVLSRGYSLTLKDDKVITKTDDISVGDIIEIKFSESSLSAEVKEKTNNIWSDLK